MSIRRVVPDISSEKLDESRDFYTNVLGFSVGMDMGWIMTFVSRTNPTAQISVVRHHSSAPMKPAITVEVADVDLVYRAALNGSAEIVYPLTDEPWGVRRFFVADPNGVVLNIMSHSKSDDS